MQCILSVRFWKIFKLCFIHRGNCHPFLHTSQSFPTTPIKHTCSLCRARESWSICILDPCSDFSGSWASLRIEERKTRKERPQHSGHSCCWIQFQEACGPSMVGSPASWTGAGPTPGSTPMGLLLAGDQLWAFPCEPSVPVPHAKAVMKGCKCKVRGGPVLAPCSFGLLWDSAGTLAKEQGFH